MTQALQLYPTSEQDITLTPDEIESILLMIEQITPEEIVSPAQLIQVGPYSFAQIRLAIAQATISHVRSCV